ncbi:MAG: T9SS type A sorting domain-containing protein [Bacteroidales bacterium]|nr:T9SS type A sorting domain-containing protein [Bacteroidales bacterium]
MRKITVLLFFVVGISSLKAQTLEWITTGAGNNIYSNEDIGYSVVSTDDYIYLTGYVEGNNVRIQDTTIYHGDFSFLAKYDKSGDLKWIRENEGEVVTDVAINSNGEVYTFYTTWDLKNYILKFDEDGNELWNKRINNNNIDKITSITIDVEDNLILSGHYYANIDSLVIEDTVIYDISRKRTNSFVMKYNLSGEFEWFNTTKIISGYGGYVVFNDIQSDKNGDIIVIGDYELYAENDSLQIGDFYLNSESNPVYAPYYFSHKDIVLAKLDSKGKFLWANKYGGYKNDLGNKIAVNELSEIFIVGVFTDSIYFDDIKLAKNGVNIYLSKVSTTGDIEWANKLGGNNSMVEEGRTVSMGENSVYVGGMYDGSYFYFGSTNIEDTILNNGSNIRAGFIAKYSLSGNFIYVDNLLTENNLNIETAKIEDININNNNIYVTGNFYPPSTFLNTTIPTVYNNTNHFFLASLNTNSTTNFSKIYSNKIDFYPNPAQDYIIVELEIEKNIISICDLKGNILISEKNSRINNKIDISSLKKGLYILKIWTNNEFYIDKFIKVD